MAVRSRANRDVSRKPRVRRAYFECRYGQLHVYNAMPAGGGFEEATTLLCLHETPLTGRMFSGVLALFGWDRSVYAPDIPGFGQSDSPMAPPSIADYANSIGDFLDSMRLRQIDLLGCQTGALIAAELAISRPTQIRRVVLASVPALNAAERADFLRAPWPAAPSEDGSYLLAEWRRSTANAKGSAMLDVAARRIAAMLDNGPNASWGMRAAAQYPAEERLRLITQPVMTLRPKDEYWESALRLRILLPAARAVDLPQEGAGWFEAAPEALVDAVSHFLHG
jgi:pimeloyl-ACP methyl ester carboxylesterase